MTYCLSYSPSSMKNNLSFETRTEEIHYKLKLLFEMKLMSTSLNILLSLPFPGSFFIFPLCLDTSSWPNQWAWKQRWKNWHELSAIRYNDHLNALRLMQQSTSVSGSVHWDVPGCLSGARLCHLAPQCLLLRPVGNSWKPTSVSSQLVGRH